MLSFNDLLQLVIAQGYLFIFIIMLIEGPIITIVSAFAAALGYFNIYYIFLITFAGNLLPDILFYYIGYFARSTVINRKGKFLGVKKEHLEQIEKYSSKNILKSLLLVKLVPFMALPGLMTMGALRIPFKKYLRLVSAIIVGNSLFFLIIGYYFGSAYRSLLEHFQIQTYFIFFFIIAIILCILAYRKIVGVIIEKIED